MQALQVAGAGEEALDRLEDAGRLRQPSDAGQARRQLADLRLDHEVAELAQLRHVALGRRVGPHAGVHGRRHDHRGAAGARDGGHRVDDQSGGELAEQVRRGRSQDDRVGRLGQLDVGDLVLGVELEDVVEHGPVGEAGEGERADEAGGRRGHGHVDHRAALLEQAHQRHGLVGGDAAGDADHDAAAGERPRPLAHRSTLRAVVRSRSRIACHA